MNGLGRGRPPVFGALLACRSPAECLYRWFWATGDFSHCLLRARNLETGVLMPPPSPQSYLFASLAPYVIPETRRRCASNHASRSGKDVGR